ncbi:MAG TPA: hypothetical protein VGG97_20230 [Bryobacteraceae bacterium]
MKQILTLSWIAALSAASLGGADFPQAEISNKVIHAKLYLPDAENGYYRSSRFDWSGVIASLTYDGHSFFGKWFDRYDPTINDAITGPVEEFRNDEGGLGYNDAKPGGYFVKIGVGTLRKPDDRPYSFGRYYQIINKGHRVVRPEADRVEFVHELNDGEGYAYVYKKTVRLTGNKPELVLEHSLKNTGKKVIDTSVYNHDFYMIDNQPSGPDFRVRFAFEPKATEDLKGAAEIRGKELRFLRELQHTPGKSDSAFTPITGFGDTAADNDFVVENRKTGAGVREIGNRPLSLINFWSIRNTVCPEAYVHMRIEPGETFKWQIRYQFYTFAPDSK